jgi:M6 family metalloprotease-like protein
MRQPMPSALAVTGVLRVPYILVRFNNTDPFTLRPVAAYDSVITLPTAPVGKPYSIRTLYDELSNGLLSLQGQVIGWITLDSNDTWYEGNCNGLCQGGSSGGHMGQLLQEALIRADSIVDFGMFDNDGPDGNPNSGDDDGVVDFVGFVQPEVDGACGGNPNIWSHKFFYSGWNGSPFTTNDARAGSGFIQVNSYTIQSGVGGSTACNGSEIMPVGTMAHETGHAFGLPDLYDTNPDDSDDSEGIGQWGLMGSGNYTSPFSPSHMESWTRNELGWITVVPLVDNGTYTFGPTTSRDTVFLVRPPVTNTRGEYFLLENRQAVLSDSALIRIQGPGLLIWHADSVRLLSSSPNTGSIHGLWLRQADGLEQLRSSTQGVRNRGDAGDPYPGSTNNTSFGFDTNPANVLNSTGGFAAFVIDSILQVVPGNEMAFRLRFGGVSIVQASDTTARVTVRGQQWAQFRDVFQDGDTLTMSIDSAQTNATGRTQYVFQSWSDAGARSHVATMTLAGSTITANVQRKHKVQVTISGNGTVLATPTVDLVNGEFVTEGGAVSLTATPGAGVVFSGWSGDTTASSTTLDLTMTRPFVLTASFAPQLAVSDTVLRAPVVGAAYSDTIRMSGGTGAYTFSLVTGTGTLPPGLSLSTAGVISGTPSKDSTYLFTVRATSGGQTLDLPLRLAVTVPTLALSAVIGAFLGSGPALSAEENRYLDIIGNNNNQLDIGDVIAWLDKTGNAVNEQTMAQLMRRAPR